MAFSTLTGAIRIDSSGVTEGVNDAEQSLDSFAGKTEAVGSRMQSAGKSLTMGVTAPIAAMAGAAAKTAADFDQSMARSMSVMSDVSDSMEEDLRDTAREVARETTVSASEAADALYDLSSAGLDAAEAMEAMPQVAVFSEAAGDALSMSEAASTATDVMNAFGYESSEMGEVTDTLTKAVQSHNQTLGEMSSAMSQVAPVAASTGTSLEETAAAVGLLGDSGISAEKAGTGLRSILIGLNDQASPLNKQLKEMGVQTQNAQGEMLSLTEILQNMRDAGIDASDASRLFTREASAAGATLLEQAGSFDEATESIKNADGATEDMAETQRDTLNAELKNMRNNLEDAGITIGTVLLPMLSTLTGYVTSAAERFQGLSDGQQKAIIATAGVAAAIGPMLLLLGTAAQSVVALSGAYGVLSGVLTGGVIPAALATQVALGPITVPIWAIIAAVGALVGAGAALYHGWTNNVWGLRDATVGVFRDVKSWFTSAPAWMLMLLGPVGQLYLGWCENLFGIKSIVGNVFGWIGDKIDWLRDKITDLPGIGGDGIMPSSEDISDAAGEAGYLSEDDLNAEPEIDPETAPPDDDASEWKKRFKDKATPTITPSAESTTVPIKGEMTTAMRSVLEDGVQGYVGEDDPEKIEDAPTEIDENLFDAMASTKKGVTAERLGVSQQEFATLVDRFGGGNGFESASSTTTSSGVSASEMPDTRSPADSGSLSAGDIADAVRDALGDMMLTGTLNVDDEEWDRLVKPEVRAVLQTEADRIDRGGG